MCCNGCVAVARAIIGNGLADYYCHRDALPESPREAMPALARDLALYDHPEVQKSFVRPAGEHEREAALILEGITCAACVWLNESHLARQPGVTAVDINYATRRARVRWDERRIHLSQILAAVAAIGYRAHPYDANKLEQLARKERRSALWRLFVAGFGMMQVMMYALPAYIATEGSMTADIAQLMRWASFALTLPVMFYSSAPFFVNAWHDIRLLRVGMDVPVALGVGSAFMASSWATVAGAGEVYFDSVTMFIFLLLGGRYLEMMARQQAVRNVESLARAVPAVAERLLRYPAHDSETIVAADLRCGDVVLVRPGNAIPADGAVIEGESHADESLLTGESRPVAKRVDDKVIGGSVNIDSPLTLRVTRVGEQTRLAAIRRLMDQAAMEKPRLVRVADRVAARFVSALLVLAAVTAAVWYFIDPSRALWVFVSVLVVSCPCALSLAMPAALTVASGVLSRRGLLVAHGHAIETLAKATHIMFDKTGTLTRGQLQLVEVLPCRDLSKGSLRIMAAALERGSTHPIAHALGQGSTTFPHKVEQLRTHTGGGIEAWVDGILVRLGKPEFAAALHAYPVPQGVVEWQAEGATVVAMADAQGWLGFFRLADSVRADAAAMVRELHALQLQLGILSGDSGEAAQHVANELAIEHVTCRLAPEAKREHIRAAQTRGAIVAMVGDGVNDAPVLAQAQVSIAMGSGTDLARTQSDLVLMGESLMPIADGIGIARRTLAIVRQNLAWAFVYNLTAIPLAMAGWVTPWMAGIGMSASSLLVVLNALRLQKS
ncbi:Type cbb3 cytochrome oxidase biogenesis protein CcoI; Copper-translocating P-type ATPase [Georgfuchsia toluolica]|uniref:Type cbb3 cytochrome oxidase biogenesis protein CcoI Copper-translocating P-type ATPase n=2 Tax=Georgfuchsia toluolica TaxID=424218 RepID=A0A916J229_9PROT|nr:Type cbb3 cytochrome oxidase biogenesis protein CcoI; Copper-translocating P-type ATPase [Georgfuchsia toluolica]